MRGTHKGEAGRVCHVGIIPAYAGNTGRVVLPQPGCKDHPRVCGEHYYPVTIPEDALGSSPRMRGTPNYDRP